MRFIFRTSLESRQEVNEFREHINETMGEKIESHVFSDVNTYLYDIIIRCTDEQGTMLQLKFPEAKIC